MISDRGYDNSGSFYGVHVHGRPWMSEQSFISEHCFRKATYKNIRTSLNSITMATVVILFPKAQNLLKANDHLTMATFTKHTFTDITI
jgi:hypothetical protein